MLPPNYQPPALFTTTWFRRVIGTQNGEADTSNPDSTVVIQNPVPTVYQVGNILSTDPYSGYQWEKNSVNIPGATSQSYVVTSPGAYSVGVDSAGCWGYSQEVVVSSVDVDDLEYNNSVSVAPNPARNQITVRATQSEVGAARIMNLLGRIVKTFSLKEKGTVVDVSDLNSGTYILIVPGSPHSYPLKLFIE